MNDDQILIEDERLDDANKTEERNGIRFFAIVFLFLALLVLWGCVSKLPECWHADTNRECSAFG